MPNLTSQMEAVCRRFEELSIRLNQPETAADPAQFRRLMQEYHEAEPVVEAITPVPGGVGTVTTSVLVSHVVEAAAKAAS